MGTQPLDVLHLEPEENTRFFLEREAKKLGLNYHGVSSLEEFVPAVLAATPKVVVMNTVVNYNGVPKLAGEVVSDLRRIHPDSKLIFYSSDDITAEHLAELHNAQSYCVGVASPSEVVKGMVRILGERK
ncbi:MAG: hypothetical protein AABX35_04565 [Nanoarchaeota archaeon]